MPVHARKPHAIEEVCSSTGFPVAEIALYGETRQIIAYHGLRTQATSPGNQTMRVPIGETMSGVVV